MNFFFQQNIHKSLFKKSILTNKSQFSDKEDIKRFGELLKIYIEEKYLMKN